MEAPPKANWQDRLLPLMVRMLIFLALFFFVATCAQLYSLHQEITAEREQYLSSALDILPVGKEYKDPVAVAQLKAQIILEELVIRRNFHQANILLLSRTWVRYLGFVTGMILAFVGATFILGKLKTEENSLESTFPNGNFTLKSHSPGLILAGMGAILMAMTIVVNHQITTQHRAIYFQGYSMPLLKMEEPVMELPDLPVDTLSKSN